MGNSHDEKIARMKFGSVYPLYLNKVVKKGRTEQELLEVIHWLTGYSEEEIARRAGTGETFETFFDSATLPANAHLITGVICGYRVEDLENPLTQMVRYLDKLVDELAKGRATEKILR